MDYPAGKEQLLKSDGNFDPSFIDKREEEELAEDRKEEINRVDKQKVVPVSSEEREEVGMLFVKLDQEQQRRDYKLQNGQLKLEAKPTEGELIEPDMLAQVLDKCKETTLVCKSELTSAHEIREEHAEPISGEIQPMQEFYSYIRCGMTCSVLQCCTTYAVQTTVHEIGVDMQSRQWDPGGFCRRQMLHTN